MSVIDTLDPVFDFGTLFVGLLSLSIWNRLVVVGISNVKHLSRQSQDMALKKFTFISGARIAELREQKGYDQAGLGKSVGVSRQTINTWEGKTVVKVKEPDALKLAKVLGVQLNDLSQEQKVPRGTSRQSQDYVPSHVLDHYRNTAEHIMSENDNLWTLVKELRAERRGAKQTQ